MEQKKLIIVTIAIIVVVIAGIGAYMWYQDQFSANIAKAKGYEIESTKSLSEYGILKDNSDVATLNKTIADMESTSKQIKDNLNKESKVLNDTRTFAKNDAEKSYVDLLMRKNTLNRKVLDYYDKTAQSFKALVTDDDSLNYLSIEELIKYEIESENDQKEIKTIDKEISTLVKNNPDLKKQLESTNVGLDYLGTAKV